ncbi:MAG TPA: YaaL family protein [Lachnospiraceae bacterium]|nr:YaaL family protein [Lachnospiraceae bacterium]
MKTQFSQSTYEDSGMNSILNDIEKTKWALENAYAGFDNATDPALIDCYIYEVNSVLKRYTFLLEQAAKLRPLPDESSENEEVLCQETAVTSLIG